MRHALSEAEWKTIQPILPCKPRGVPRVDDRRVPNGIFWVLRVDRATTPLLGCSMSDMITEVMHIKCPAAKAFDPMADARNETRWNSGVSKVELKSGEPIGEGTQFAVVDKRGQHEARITAYNRPEGLSFVVHDAGMDVDIDHVLTEADGATTMTGRFNARGKGLMKFLLPLLVPLIRRDLAKEHAHFVRLCETAD